MHTPDITFKAAGHCIQAFRSRADILAAILDIILPRHCIVCGRKLLLNEKIICIYCHADFPYTYNWNMSRNRMADKFNAFIQKHIDDITGLRNGQHEPYALAVSLFMYRGNAGYRRIPQSLKYHGDMAAGKFFGSELGKRIAASPHFSDIDTIIPVPLHWKREWDRGYNQSLIIAREIASWTGATLKPFLLRRKKKTGTQTRLSIEEKEANVDNAFAVPERYASHVPASSHILLVDDVFTTGATLFFCFKALRWIYGPETRISVATLAVVDNG